MTLSNQLEVSRFEGDVALLETDPPIKLGIGNMYTASRAMTVATREFLSSFLDIQTVSKPE